VTTPSCRNFSRTYAFRGGRCGRIPAIFSVVNAVLLRPLPFRNPESLCLLTERLPAFPTPGPSRQNFQDWRGQAQSVERIAAARKSERGVARVSDYLFRRHSFPKDLTR